MNRTRLRNYVAIAACAIVGVIVVRHRHAAEARSPLWPGAVELHVPHLQGTITLDGDTDDSGWRGPTGHTGAFVAADGIKAVHPHSEARFVWGDEFLYMNLYASDEDIRVASTASDSLSPDEDAFHLVFTDEAIERIIDVNPLGVVTDATRPTESSGTPDRSWSGHLHVSHEVDGTPNHPQDNDEEWVLEMAIPLQSLGLHGRHGERIGFSAERCDTPRDGKRVCGSWGVVGRRAVLVLD